jgi:hypothetical protein
MFILIIELNNILSSISKPTWWLLFIYVVRNMSNLIYHAWTLHSFQIIHVSIIYKKNCHNIFEMTLKIDIIFNTKTWNIKHWLQLFWIMLMWLYPFGKTIYCFQDFGFIIQSFFATFWYHIWHIWIQFP